MRIEKRDLDYLNGLVQTNSAKSCNAYILFET